MPLPILYGLTLLLAVLISERAKHTVLSTNVLFLAVGFAAGPGMLGWLDVTPESPLVKTFSQLALFSILFVDAARLPVKELREAWRLPGRALLLGLPLTVVSLALLARLLTGLEWAEALLLGAVLSPTDPVFASALLSQEAVPERLRKLLAIESGVNDGLALPLVVVLLALSASKPPHPWMLTLEVVSGIALGVALAWGSLKLEGSRFFGARASYRPLGSVALAITLFGLCELWHFNEYLAAFAAGATVASIRPEAAGRLRAIGEPLAELLKLAAVFLFGALITPALLGSLGWRGWLFVALALVLARPVALVPALAGSGLSRREWWTAAWFGPKGFASVVYALLVLGEALPEGQLLYHLVAATTMASMVAHSSTDVLVARGFQRGEEPPRGPRPQPPVPTA